jgi:hypothetical protein
MFKLDSSLARILLRNGALLIITFGLWGALPAAYSPDIFWKDIPGWLSLLENIFRILVFSLPGILYFGKKRTGAIFGLVFIYWGIGGLSCKLFGANCFSC